jgi:serine/threonine-protein kinase
MARPIDAARWHRLSALLDEALDLPVSERAEHLRAACPDDPSLADEAADLLAAADAAGDLLERPAAEDAAALVAAALREAVATDDSPASAGDQIGPFRVVRLIGEGGMGAVYLGERTDGQFEQQAAIKRLRRGVHGEAGRQRFLRERQILARLEHPGIARLLDGGVVEATGLPYFAMEYVDGEPITDYCRRLPLDARLQIFLQVCDAVAYAHRNLVVHRDLKPSNVFVDRAGRVRLLDFGIAKLIGDEADTSVTGLPWAPGPMTLQYAAPEQILGEPVTTGTDVYALGVLLCELLTGCLPYRGDRKADAALRKAIAEAEAVAPSAVAGNDDATAGGLVPEGVAALRGDLDHIVLKAVRKEPAARYVSVEAFAADIRRHLARYPVLAAGDAWSYRTRRFLSRHRIAAVTALVALSTVVAAMAGVAWQARKARLEADRARAVQGFLVSLFKTTEPGAGAQERTARDILDAGTARIDAELAGQPDLQVELWRTVADIQRQFGAYDRAERLLEKAVEVQRRTAGDDDVELARTRLQLASVLNDHYRGEDARRLAEQAAPVIERRLGATSAEMGDAFDLLGSLAYGRGDYAAAERLRLQALAVYRARFGEGSLQVAGVQSNLAVFHAERGRYADAIAAGRRAVDIRLRALGPDHPDTLLARYNLANAQFQAGQWAEASQAFEQILPAQRRVLGAAHPHTALTERQIARVFVGLGRYEEAARMLDAVAEVTNQSYGADSVAAGYVTTQRSRLEQVRGRFDEAVRLARAVLATFERTLGADHAETAWARMNLGDRLIDAGAFDEADRELDRAARVLGGATGSRDPYLAQTLDLQGVAASRRGRTREACALFERALALFEAGEAADVDRAPARWHFAAAGCDAPLRRRAQLFEQAVTALRRGFPSESTTTTEALVAYGGFLTGIGRLAEAERVLREVLDVRQRTLGADNVLTAEAAAALARCLFSIGRIDEARRLDRQARDVLARYPYRRTVAPAPEMVDRGEVPGGGPRGRR